jgi:hypothetical protein
MRLPLINFDELAELQISPRLAIENALHRYVLPAFDLRELLGLVLTKPTSNWSSGPAFLFFKSDRTLIIALARHRRGNQRVTSDDDFFAVVFAAHSGTRPLVFVSQSARGNWQRLPRRCGSAA